MERPTIELEAGTARATALVAMGPGRPRDAVEAVLAGLGAEVATTEVRGQRLLATIAERRSVVVVVELSRLGEAGLRGLSGTARQCPGVCIVLLLPGGLGGPGASTLGIAGVLVESDVAGLRTLAGVAVFRGVGGQAR